MELLRHPADTKIVAIIVASILSKSACPSSRCGAFGEQLELPQQQVDLFGRIERFRRMLAVNIVLLRHPCDVLFPEIAAGTAAAVVSWECEVSAGASGAEARVRIGKIDSRRAGGDILLVQRYRAAAECVAPNA